MSKHTEALVSDFLVDGWRAACSCGWDGPTRNDLGRAHEDFVEHVASLPTDHKKAAA